MTVALITDVHYRMSASLIRSLAKAGVRIYTCEKDIFPSPAGARSKYVTAHFSLPEKEYENALYALAERLGKKEGCKPALLPVGAATLQLLSAQKERFSAVAGLCVAMPDALSLLNSKRELHALARSLSVSVPQNYEGAYSLPCVVKPICGEKLGLSAAERYRICHTCKEVEDACAHFEALSGESPIIQEYLPGGGSGCSIVAEKGKILAYIGHRRLREYPVSGGPSSCCISVEPPISEVEKLVKSIHLSGLAMFEFKEGADGKPRLLECNPRIWGSFPLTEAANSTLPFAWFAAAWNNGNPNDLLSLPQNHFETEKKMCFFPSDLFAGLGYFKKGHFKKSFCAVADFIDPRVRDGVFTFKDPAPALTYYFHRGGKK